MRANRGASCSWNYIDINNNSPFVRPCSAVVCLQRNESIDLATHVWHIMLRLWWDSSTPVVREAVDINYISLFNYIHLYSWNDPSRVHHYYIIPTACNNDIIIHRPTASNRTTIMMMTIIFTSRPRAAMSFIWKRTSAHDCSTRPPHMPTRSDPNGIKY